MFSLLHRKPHRRVYYLKIMTLSTLQSRHLLHRVHVVPQRFGHVDDN